MNFPFRGRRDAPRAVCDRAAIFEAQHEQEQLQVARLFASKELIRDHMLELLGTKQTDSLALDSLRLTLHRKPVLGGVLNYSEDDQPLRTVFDIAKDNLEIVTYTMSERLRFRFARAPEDLFVDANGNRLPLNSQQAQEGLIAAEKVCQRLGDLCVAHAA